MRYFWICLCFLLFPQICSAQSLFSATPLSDYQLASAKTPAGEAPPLASSDTGPAEAKVPAGILPSGKGKGTIQFALAGPVGFKIQTGNHLVNPEWRTTFPTGEQNIKLKNLQIWDTRLSVVLPFLGFYFEGGFILGGVIDGKMEHYDLNNGTTSKFTAEISGVSFGFSGNLYHQIWTSNFYFKFSFDYSYNKFYADSASASTVNSTGGEIHVAGLDSWYTWEWLETRIGVYYMPGKLLTGMFMGFDFVPGLWFFGKGRDRWEDSRFTQGTTDIFGKGGWGFAGLMGYQVQISPQERMVFGFEWKYLKISDGYYKRQTSTTYRRSRMIAETGNFWMFVRYERSF